MAQPTAQLPVFSIIADAYRYVWQGRDSFMVTAALPVVALALFDIVVYVLFGPLQSTLVELTQDGIPTDDPEKAAALASEALRAAGLGLGYSLVTFAFYVMFAVAWHRKWLIGPEQITLWSALKWEARKTRFMWRMIMLGLIAVLAAALLMSLVQMLGNFLGAGALLVVSVVAGLIFARLVLILPAAAVDEPVSLQQSWEAVRGNVWRVLLVVVAPALPISLALTVVMLIAFSVIEAAGLADTLSARFATSLLREAVSYVGIAVSVTALSVTYRHFIPKGGPQINPAPASSE